MDWSLVDFIFDVAEACYRCHLYAEPRNQRLIDFNACIGRLMKA